MLLDTHIRSGIGKHLRMRASPVRPWHSCLQHTTRLRIWKHTACWAVGRMCTLSNIPFPDSLPGVGGSWARCHIKLVAMRYCGSQCMNVLPADHCNKRRQLGRLQRLLGAVSHVQEPQEFCRPCFRNDLSIVFRIRSQWRAHPLSPKQVAGLLYILCIQ